MEKEQIGYFPTVYPTIEEFIDFQAYVNKLDADSEIKGYGAVKVVPPKEWKACKEDIEKKFDGLKVIGPIEQNFHSHPMKGFYELVLIQKKSMKLHDYKKRAEKFDQDHGDSNIEKVEEKFWRSQSFNPPIYGADVKGSLFDKDVPWNLAELSTVLNDGLGNSKIYGINEPYFYFGAWRTTFAWHTEDLNLPAINFLHYGKPKFWYSIGRHDGHLLEEVVKKYMNDSFAKCAEHMRHKTTLVNPYILKKLCPEITIHKQIQREGEFIINFPGCYHAGFNWGFNIAEAVNFGVHKWLDVFPKCGVCQCQENNVNINPVEFYKNLITKNPKMKSSPVSKGLRGYIKDNLGENLERIHEQIEARYLAITNNEMYNKAMFGGRKMIRYQLYTENELPDDQTDQTNSSCEAKNSTMKSQKIKEVKKITVIKITKANSNRKSPRIVTNNRKNQKPTEKKIKKTNTKKLQKEISKEEQLIHWVQCEACYKWRRIPSGFNKNVLKKKFYCNFFKANTCETSEESWRRHYTTISKD